MIDDEYDKISGDMYVPKNLSLSKSSKIDGGFSELARDANNKLQDHAVFVPHGERDSSESRAAKGRCQLVEATSNRSYASRGV